MASSDLDKTKTVGGVGAPAFKIYIGGVDVGYVGGDTKFNIDEAQGSMEDITQMMKVNLGGFRAGSKFELTTELKEMDFAKLATLLNWEHYTTGGASKLRMTCNKSKKTRHTLKVEGSIVEGTPVAVAAEVVALTGSGLGPYTGTLAETPVESGTVTFSFGETFVDDGYGKLIGDDGGHGWITYATGEIHDLYWGTAESASIDVDYEYGTEKQFVINAPAVKVFPTGGSSVLPEKGTVGIPITIVAERKTGEDYLAEFDFVDYTDEY